MMPGSIAHISDVAHICFLLYLKLLTVNMSYSYSLHIMITHRCRERGGLVVNASDSGSRGLGFEPHSGQTMLCP